MGQQRALVRPPASRPCTCSGSQSCRRGRAGAGWAGARRSPPDQSALPSSSRWPETFAEAETTLVPDRLCGWAPPSWNRPRLHKILMKPHPRLLCAMQTFWGHSVFVSSGFKTFGRVWYIWPTKSAKCNSAVIWSLSFLHHDKWNTAEVKWEVLTHKESHEKNTNQIALQLQMKWVICLLCYCI